MILFRTAVILWERMRLCQSFVGMLGYSVCAQNFGSFLHFAQVRKRARRNPTVKSCMPFIPRRMKVFAASSNLSEPQYAKIGRFRHRNLTSERLPFAARN